MRAVKLSWRDAQAIVAFVDEIPELVVDPPWPAVERLRSAMKLKPAVRKARKEKAKKRATGKAATRLLRLHVAERAGNFCECGCGLRFLGLGGGPEMDHFEGIARSETLETCWMLRQDCHRAKHRDGNPGAWRAKFINHCLRHGYTEAAKKVGAMVAADALIEEAASLSRGAELAKGAR